jgi:hypothetical protein
MGTKGHPATSGRRQASGNGKPALCVFCGDTHTGSDTGLAPARYWMESKSRYYGLSRTQSWLSKCFGEFILLVNEYRATHEILVFFGGDMVDGVQHHGSIQTIGTRKEQIEMAVEATRPLWSIAEEVFVCYGTAAHVGEGVTMIRASRRWWARARSIAGNITVWI